MRVDANIPTLSIRTAAGSLQDGRLAELATLLPARHQRIIRDELAAIRRTLRRASEAGDGDARALGTALTRLCELVLHHLGAEEVHVFPAMEALAIAWDANQPELLQGDFRPRLQRLVLEHGTIAAQLRAVREIVLRLDGRSDLAPEWRSLLDAIDGLEQHIHEYIFLENCIVFPRAVAMDEQMKAKSVPARTRWAAETDG